MKQEVIFIHVETDEIVIAPLAELPGWPEEMQMLQHSWITPEEDQLLISTDAVAPGAASIIMLELGNIDWKGGKADLKVRKIVKLDEPGTPSKFPEVNQVDPAFPIPDWTRSPYTQSHRPTFLPRSPFTYITHLGDNRIRGLNYKTGQLIEADPMSFGDLSGQMHGINFNPAGKLGLGVGYFFDDNQIDIYKVDSKTGKVRLKAVAILGTPEEYAAFTHFTHWIDDRYAVTATMQLGPTSITEEDDAKIIGPSVWLIDAKTATATKIIGTAPPSSEAGVYRSASDVAVAKGKLYVAEEDSLREEFATEGFVAVYDFTDMHDPKFIKRLKPGVELPSDFRLGHAMAVTVDEDAVYVSSYISNHIVKINTTTDEVVKVYTAEDGLDIPHGEFISGRLR
ncbi:MAG: hypothetical protein H0X43_12655 [Nitrosospira sp.]|nr:hypothetical protein [Nitrosospira sp.]